ncbi:hypothetical protein CRE_23662 [Caenorhabditis remanei]|uniref:Uncharacterized protein n=1 Tax=Caenorhabditis remanei TaxID=31234 RepID=E3N472_CAERE|nr:hypothetical protein CRE_23662 [Caenorhabditis remanei]
MTIRMFINLPRIGSLGPTIKAEILREFGENVQGNLFNPGQVTFRLQETFMDFEGFPDLGGSVESQDEQVTNRGVQNTPNFDFGNIWVEIPPENWRIMRRKMERTKTMRILPQKKKKEEKDDKDDDGEDDEDSESEMEVDDDLEEQNQEFRNDWNLIILLTRNVLSKMF